MTATLTSNPPSPLLLLLPLLAELDEDDVLPEEPEDPEDPEELEELEPEEPEAVLPGKPEEPLLAVLPPELPCEPDELEEDDDEEELCEPLEPERDWELEEGLLDELPPALDDEDDELGEELELLELLFCSSQPDKVRHTSADASANAGNACSCLSFIAVCPVQSDTADRHCCQRLCPVGLNIVCLRLREVNTFAPSANCGHFAARHRLLP